MRSKIIKMKGAFNSSIEPPTRNAGEGEGKAYLGWILTKLLNSPDEEVESVGDNVDVLQLFLLFLGKNFERLLVLLSRLLLGVGLRLLLRLFLLLRFFRRDLLLDCELDMLALASDLFEALVDEVLNEGGNRDEFVRLSSPEVLVEYLRDGPEDLADPLEVIFLADGLGERFELHAEDDISNVLEQREEVVDDLVVEFLLGLGVVGGRDADKLGDAPVYRDCGPGGLEHVQFLAQKQTIFDCEIRNLRVIVELENLLDALHSLPLHLRPRKYLESQLAYQLLPAVRLEGAHLLPDVLEDGVQHLLPVVADSEDPFSESQNFAPFEGLDEG